jgi:hypothetical protein
MDNGKEQKKNTKYFKLLVRFVLIAEAKIQCNPFFLLFVLVMHKKKIAIHLF